MRIQKTVKPLEGPVGDNGSGWHNAARLESCVRDGRSGMSSVVDVEGIATCAGAIDAFITTSHTSSARGTALNELYKRCQLIPAHWTWTKTYLEGKEPKRWSDSMRLLQRLVGLRPRDKIISEDNTSSRRTGQYLLRVAMVGMIVSWTTRPAELPERQSKSQYPTTNGRLADSPGSGCRSMLARSEARVPSASINGARRLVYASQRSM